VAGRVTGRAAMPRDLPIPLVEAAQ